MGMSDMGEQGLPSDPGLDASSVASDATRHSTPAQRGGLQDARARVGHFLSTVRVARVWGAHGLSGVIVGLILLDQLGAALSPIRAILSVWILLTAATTAWRWHLDGRRSRYLLTVSVIGLVAGILALLGIGLSLSITLLVFGLFWIAAGLLELFAWFQRPRPAVQWPWISGFILFVGVVFITFPHPLVPILTVLGSVWAIVLGLVHLVRWLWLSRHAGHLSRPARKPSLLIRMLSVVVPALLLAVPVLVYGRVLAGSVAESSRQASLDAFYQALR